MDAAPRTTTRRDPARDHNRLRCIRSSRRCLLSRTVKSRDCFRPRGYALACSLGQRLIGVYERRNKSMNYNIYGPYEIPRSKGEFKRRIDKEDIDEFWSSVDTGLENACGCYVFSIRTKSRKKPGYREKPWYVGKAKNQSFYQECFTPHKIVHYHDALEKSNGTPMMYFLARFTDTTNRMSRPSSSATGHAEIDFIEQLFIGMGYNKNKDIRNKKGKKNPERLVIEGFYNHKDRRKKSVKQLHKLFVDQEEDT